MNFSRFAILLVLIGAPAWATDNLEQDGWIQAASGAFINQQAADFDYPIARLVERSLRTGLLLSISNRVRLPLEPDASAFAEAHDKVCRVFAGDSELLQVAPTTQAVVIYGGEEQLFIRATPGAECDYSVFVKTETM